MTVEKCEGKRNSSVIFVFTCLCIICVMFGETLKDSILLGIKLSVSSIVPSLFPFFVISDYLSCSINYERSGLASALFEGCFGINGKAFYAFLLGNICGFPLGVKAGAQLYEFGAVGKEEFERLAAISNNPSFAFTVSVVGGGLLGDVFLGILLYISVFISTVVVGVVFCEKMQKNDFTDVNFGQTFVLSHSIKNSGMSSLTVSSYIIFFSAVIGLIGKIVKSDVIRTFIILISEIGNGTFILSSSSVFEPRIAFSLLGFGLGFSGISVHMQAFAFFKKEISKSKYLLMKTAEGGICFLISFLLSFFVIQ